METRHRWTDVMCFLHDCFIIKLTLPKYVILIHGLVRALHTIYLQAFARRQIHKTEFSSRPSLKFHIFEQ